MPDQRVLRARMHPDELDIGPGLVRRLLGSQFPVWADLPLRPVEPPGTVNAVFRLGDDMAVRLPRVPNGVPDIGSEREWLPRLAPLLPYPIPTPLGSGAPDADFPWPWSILRWIDGENPAADRLTDPAGLAADLAEFVVAMRRVDLAGGPPAYRGGPLARLDAATRDGIGQLATGPLAGTVDTDALAAIWSAALEVGPWTGPPGWVHADLLPGNLLTVDGRLRGVIDFATAGVGDPACDLIVAWTLLPASARQIFRAAVGADDPSWVRGQARALSIAVIALPYYHETNPTFAALARHVIAEVLAP